MDTQETKIYLAALIAAGIMGLILIYFIITMIRQQKRNRLLQNEKIQAEIKTLEKERTRIASDLHDEIGPILSAVKYSINSIDIVNTSDHELIEKTNRHIDNCLGKMREISNDLMPNTLLRKGVILATEEFIQNIEKTSTLKIDFRYDNIPPLPVEKAINLYRILQEIIHNTIKHAQAKDLVIELKKNLNRLILITEDNGKGFDYSSVYSENSGLGLYTLLSRTEIMHGQFSVESKTGKGTRYSFEFPV